MDIMAAASDSLGEVASKQRQGSAFAVADLGYDIFLYYPNSLLTPNTSSGHLEQLFHRHGWKFQDMLHEQYQGIVKLRGLLGVSVYHPVRPTALSDHVIARHVVCG